MSKAQWEELLYTVIDALEARGIDPTKYNLLDMDEAQLARLLKQIASLPRK